MKTDVGIKRRLGGAIFLLLILTGLSFAGTWDFNPGKTAQKFKYEYQDDMEGEGFVMSYQKVDTNNLSFLEYMHGSGTFDEADLLKAEQKTTGSPTSDYYWYYDPAKGWIKKSTYANSAVSFTKQNEMTQAPTAFAYGTGWYASHPVVYNSLLKDKTVAKSYQEATMMHHQLEYARGYRGDIAVELNCTGPTETANGIGLTSMKIEDDVLQGTVHIGVLQTDTLYNSRNDFRRQGWKEAIVEADVNYIGNFKVQKEMKMEISKSKSKPKEDWLPCCSGGFFDIPDYDKLNSGEIGIFDCNCRSQSLSTFKPAWNGSTAQYPQPGYSYKP